MIFGDKISHSPISGECYSESSKKISDGSTHLDSLPFSALHFIRNRLIPTEISSCYSLPSPGSFSNQPLPPLETILPLAKISMQSKLSPGSDMSISNPSKASSLSPSPVKSTMLINNPSAIFCNSFMRRPRGEKRPIPEEQKDEKYYERRRRNNEAAKKSRDARKLREDRVALRAALLEQENSILRAQTLALREEVCTLRQILCNRAIVSSNLSPMISNSS